MAELADALDSKSCIFGCAGSTPAWVPSIASQFVGLFCAHLPMKARGRGSPTVVQSARDRSCRRFHPVNNHTGRDSRIG